MKYRKFFVSVVVFAFLFSLAITGSQAASYPIGALNSTDWKLTLPINSAQEIKFPELATYTSEWFHLNATGDGAVFRARTDGATTSNSANPRSELRQLFGTTNAAWSSTTENNSMSIDQVVNVLPIGSKPVVVTGQIHGASDDISVFRVEGNTSGDRNVASIWITDGNTSHGHLLTNAYHLGDRYQVGFSVSGGQISYTFNGVAVAYTQKKSFTGGYFKAGSYNQSGGNCTKLADGQCDYAEVTIYAVQVCHNNTCTGGTLGNIVTPIAPTSTVAPTSTAAPTNTAAPAATPAASTATPTPAAVSTATNAPATATALPTAIISPLPTPLLAPCSDDDDNDQDHVDALAYRVLMAPYHIYLPQVGR